MKEIAIVRTRINLVFTNGGEREYEYTVAFASAYLARKYANTARAYEEAYSDALDVLGENDEIVKLYFPLYSRCQTLVLQSEV